MSAGYSVSGEAPAYAVLALNQHVPRRRLLHVYGVGEDEGTAFIHYGIECLKQIVDDERAAGRAPKPIPSTR